jgi:hypothetical protein
VDGKMTDEEGTQVIDMGHFKDKQLFFLIIGNKDFVGIKNDYPLMI